MKNGDTVEFLRAVVGADGNVQVMGGERAIAVDVHAVHDGWGFDAKQGREIVACSLVTRDYDPLVRVV